MVEVCCQEISVGYGLNHGEAVALLKLGEQCRPATCANFKIGCHLSFYVMVDHKIPIFSVKQPLNRRFLSR
jgi:hypothetical protein